MKLYTKTGDDGLTSLFNGARVRKNDLRVATYGDVDELNAQIGVARCTADHAAAPEPVRAIAEHLRLIQSDLFTIGADLATPKDSKRQAALPVDETDIARLEGLIDDATAAVPPLRSFVLPAGSMAAAQLHVCRTVCRRAERHVVTLAAEADVTPQVIVYLNRLSDLLFAWSRLANHAANAPEEPWQARK